MTDVNDLILGIAINVSGNLAINVGTNFWRYGGCLRKPGFVLIFTGNGLNFISLGFAPQALLAALSSIQFVSNLLLSWALFSERPSAAALLGTVVIAVGDVLIAFSGVGGASGSSHEEVERLLTVFWRGFAGRVFAYFIYASCVALGSLFCCMYGRSPLPFRIPFLTRSCRNCELIKDEDADALNSSALSAFIFVNFSATIGAGCVMQGKVLSLELRYMALTQGGFTMPGFMDGARGGVWLDMLVAFLAFLIMASFWAVQLGRSLRLFSGPFVIPLQQACWIFWTILGGAVTFEEFNGISVKSALFFFGGVCLLFVGVLLMVPRRKHLDSPDDGPPVDAEASRTSQSEAQPGGSWHASLMAAPVFVGVDSNYFGWARSPTGSTSTFLTLFDIGLVSQPGLELGESSTVLASRTGRSSTGTGSRTF